MLNAAGYGMIDQLDVTDRFRDTQKAWMEAVSSHYDELVAIEGAQSVRVRQRNQRVQLSAIDDGLLQRAMFTARA